MPIIERTLQQLVLRSGSTTLTLSRERDKAIMQRKILFWSLKPSEANLSDIVDVSIDTAVDRASGVEMCNMVLVMRTGAGWAFPCSDKKEAESVAETVREFLGTRV